jgi:hypothetical protein
VHSATIDGVSFRPVLAGFAVVAAVLTSACRSEGSSAPKPPEAFCDAAARYDDRLLKGKKPSLDEQMRLVQRMVDTAPAKIKADAQMFLDALRQIEADPSVRDDPKVKRAVDNVNRYAAQGCGFYERRPGGV